jgi:LmbE family N-acetylglucosaminyl deacetylase
MPWTTGTDHGRASKMTQDACFYSGLAKIETFNSDGSPQEKWRPAAIYSYIQDKQLEPDFVVDISPWVENKMEAILTFRSQFWNPGEEAPNTPISGKDFLDFHVCKNARIRTQYRGRLCGRVHLYPYPRCIRSASI